MAGWAYRVLFFCGSSADGKDHPGPTNTTVSGRLFLKQGRIDGGYIDRVEVDGEAVLIELKVTGGRLRKQDDYWLADIDVRNKVSGLHARMPDGDTVGRITVSWMTPTGWPVKWPSTPVGMSATGSIRIPVINDNSNLTAALERMITATAEGRDDSLADKPLRHLQISGQTLVAGSPES